MAVMFRHYFVSSALIAVMFASSIGAGRQVLASPVAGGKPAGVAELPLVHQGFLTVGTDARYPPYELIDATGHIAGADISLAADLARALHLKLRLVDRPFPALLPALHHGRLDLVVSAVHENIDLGRTPSIDLVRYAPTV